MEKEACLIHYEGGGGYPVPCFIWSVLVFRAAYTNGHSMEDEGVAAQCNLVPCITWCLL